MCDLSELFQNNRRWAESITQQDPDFFKKLSGQQAPRYLWIGCSDSRVPANEIVDLMPGELFVHRNVGNVVVHTDLNCLSVMQYAIDVLKVEHLMVCGHYGCGGIQAALSNTKLGLVDNWLRHIQDVSYKYRTQLAEVPEELKADLLCELNVCEQVINVAQTTAVQNAWERGQPLTLHGWIYSLKDGLLRDLNMTMSQADDLTKKAKQLGAIY